MFVWVVVSIIDRDLKGPRGKGMSSLFWTLGEVSAKYDKYMSSFFNYVNRNNDKISKNRETLSEIKTYYKLTHDNIQYLKQEIREYHAK